MKNRLLVVLVIVFVSVFAAILLATQALALPVGANGSDVQLFQASLSGANEVGPVDTPASGQAVLALGADMSKLYYRVFVNDIVSITAAHIHLGAADEIGDPVHFIYTGTGVFDPNNPISGTLILTPSQVLDLQAGNYYVNVHTADNPGGEVRGQIGSLTPRSDFSALLSGDKAVPPVTTEAVGVGRFTLVTDTLTYEVDVGDIVSITSAHIHLGAADEKGDVVHPIYTGTGVFDPDNPISGTLTLVAKEIVDLLTGYYYVNVHTVANPGGEIRGQIGGPQLFEANLSGANAVPPVDTPASGQAVLALSADSSALHYRVSVNNIISITSAHIHLGAADEKGDVVHTLYDGMGTFDPDHPISNTISLTTTDVLDLLAGDYYVNVHTVDNPGGEVRGQIGPSEPRSHLKALLSGDTAVPPVNTNRTGLARFTLDSDLSVLHYNIAVNDIVSITAAHIHRGTADENGPVVHWLYDSSGVKAPNGPLDSDNPVSGSLTLDAWSLVDLLTGYYYVNVHTPANPGGEIRGQIGGPQLFKANLSGDNQVPPVDTPASGQAVLALSADSSALHYRVSVNNIISITSAHIHLGAADEKGDVVHTLYDGMGTFDPDHPISNTISLTTADVLDLLAGDYYVNVHTVDNPGGEIRGQIGPYVPPSDLNAPLSGDNAVPPVDTEATGLARFTLDSDLSVLHYNIAVNDIVSITAAHIHRGTADEKGPVVHWLYDSSGVNAPNGPLDSDNPVSGSLTLDAWSLVDLLTGYYYVNVHTPANPGGEIRGQINGQITIPPNMIYMPVAFK